MCEGGWERHLLFPWCTQFGSLRCSTQPHQTAQSLRLAHTVCTVMCMQRKMEAEAAAVCGQTQRARPNAGCMSLSADTLALERETPPAGQHGIIASTASSFWCLPVSLVKDQHGPEAAIEKSSRLKASVDLFLHASPRAGFL